MWVKSLLYKEFRQLTPVLSVGFVLMLLVMYQLKPTTMGSADIELIPFYNEYTFYMIPMLFGAMLIAAGLWQTLAEYQRQTWLYLFHRPVSRRSITFVKLLSGVLYPSVVVGVPLVIYVSFASSTRFVAAPIPWEMIWLFLGKLLVITPVYFSSYLCGLRKSSWYFSCALPLIAFALYPFLVDEILFKRFVYVVSLAVVFNFMLVATICQSLDREDFS